MKKQNQISLKLFNSVEVASGQKNAALMRLSETVPYGFILQPEVAALPEAGEIISYLKRDILDGKQLNSSFHKSWAVIQNSSRQELLAHQLLHYFSTYGLESFGLYSDSTIYIPQEVLEVPEPVQLPLKVIKGLSKAALTEKALGLIKSGVALKEETVNDVLELLELLGYTFKTIDDIKNKEAKIKISVKYGVLPSEASEFLRLLVFKATATTLIIKSKDLIQKIQLSGKDVSSEMNKFGLAKLSQIFLRFKPLFLAFKKANKNNRKTINKLRKLAESNHSPMPVDYLNNVTAMSTFDRAEFVTQLSKANNFRKIRLLYALHIRLQEDVVGMLYKVRNGKTFVKRAGKVNRAALQEKYNIVYSSLVEGLNLAGKKVKYPTQVDYALPATEKQFIGNFPTGTTVNFEKDGVVGIYWENDWGARDLDLAAVALDKIGWNSAYKSGDNSMLFSGDVTSAPNGATELFYIKSKLNSPYLIVNNTFSGSENCSFRVFAGQEKVENIHRDYMIDPNSILFQVETSMNQRQKVVGIVIPTEKATKFVLTDFANGTSAVSGYNEKSELTRNYLFHYYNNPISLLSILVDAGCEFVEEGADIDLTVGALEKDTILNLFA